MQVRSIVQSAWRPTLIIIVYLIGWAALDYAALFFETQPEIQIWYPPSALDVVLLLVFGLRYAPVLLLNAIIHQWVTGRMLPLESFMVFDLVTSLGYATVGWLLLQVLRINPRLRRLRDVALLIGIGSFLMPLVIACLQVANFTTFGIITRDDALLSVLRYWAGDATGVAMLTPWLLLTLRRWPGLWATPEHAPPMRSLEVPNRRTLVNLGLEGLAFLVCLWVAYGVPRGAALDYTYFVFLALTWFAVRYGVYGAALSVLITNIVAVILVQNRIASQKILTLQFGLMIASQLGILLGAFIGEQRRLGAERQELDRALAVAQRQESVARVARSIAHDFNNMLTAVRGNLELALIDTPQSHPAHESIAAANTAAGHATDLSQQLLAYTGRAQTFVPLDCNLLVKSSESLLRSVVPRTISVSISLASTTALVYGDATSLRQVLLNLVLNAADALGTAGTIIITTSTEELLAPMPLVIAGGVLQPRSYLCLAVADSGPGMSAATQARLFEPFFTTKSQGHGLGMGVVLSVVRAHDGGIMVETELGTGTTFRVMLPLLSPPSETASGS